jgi:hypothetical protein
MKGYGILKIKISLDDQPFFKDSVDNPKKLKNVFKELEEKFK